MDKGNGQQFDVKRETDYMEGLAKERLDAPPGSISSQLCAKALCEEWQKMTPDQRAQVANELSAKYDNSDWNTLPRPHVLRDASGQISGVEFSKASFASGEGPKHIEVISENGRIYELQAEYYSTSPPERFPDCSIDDKQAKPAAGRGGRDGNAAPPNIGHGAGAGPTEMTPTTQHHKPQRA